MDIARVVRDEVGRLVASTAYETHREDHFTVILFAQLWPVLQERLLYSTGLGLDPLLSKIKDSETDHLRQTRLPKTKDFYPDLIITAPLNGVCRKSTIGIDHFIDQFNVTHLYEFKYLTAFTTLSRGTARKDTYKLKILGEYVRVATGQLPHLEQFIVMTNRPAKRTHTIESLQSWFNDEQIKIETEGVQVSIMDTAGGIHTGKV